MKPHRLSPWARRGLLAWLLLSPLLGCSPASGPHLLSLGQHGMRGGGLPANTVLLTFDDGPDEHTRELATYLASQGVHATFFINGRRFCDSVDASGACLTLMATRPCDNGGTQAAVAMPQYYPESIIDDVLALGHHVGNHTQDHCQLLGERSADDFAFELDTTEAILRRHVSDGLYLFRPPYGGWNASTDKRAHAAQTFDELVGPVMWDIDGRDWDCWRSGMTVDACGERYLQLLQKRHKHNGIVLMHDRPEFNVGSVNPLLLAQWLVPRLQALGYRFADLDEWLAGDQLPDGDELLDDSAALEE